MHVVFRSGWPVTEKFDIAKTERDRRVARHEIAEEPNAYYQTVLNQKKTRYKILFKWHGSWRNRVYQVAKKVNKLEKQAIMGDEK